MPDNNAVIATRRHCACFASHRRRAVTAFAIITWPKRRPDIYLRRRLVISNGLDRTAMASACQSPTAVPDADLDYDFDRAQCTSYRAAMKSTAIFRGPRMPVFDRLVALQLRHAGGQIGGQR